MMAEARELEPAELLRRLELVPAHHDVDAPLRPRVEVLYGMMLGSPALMEDLADGARCQCSHITHARVHPAPVHGHALWPAGARLALNVGRVCDECAVTHQAGNLVELGARV